MLQRSLPASVKTQGTGFDTVRHNVIHICNISLSVPELRSVSNYCRWFVGVGRGGPGIITMPLSSRWDSKYIYIYKYVTYGKLRYLTYPTWAKGTSSWKMPWDEICSYPGIWFLRSWWETSLNQRRFADFHSHDMYWHVTSKHVKSTVKNSGHKFLHQSQLPMVQQKTTTLAYVGPFRKEPTIIIEFFGKHIEKYRLAPPEMIWGFQKNHRP